MHNKSILIIYTGGTIGMVRREETGALSPLNFDQISEEVPELKKFGAKIDTVEFENPIDSSDVDPSIWIKIAKTILDNYDKYYGFVVLHGTDTMAYTASALSFMFDGLKKPVILTGSQLPIGTLRTDGKENLITAIEVATAEKEGEPIVQEVCIYFEFKLHRGNRTTKYNTEHFDAFRSPNFIVLADAGIEIVYRYHHFYYPKKDKELTLNTLFDTNVAVLRLFPGITPQYVESVLNTENLKGVIIESFGAGNIFTQQWFIDKVKKAIERGVIFVNKTQCTKGSVKMGLYETSLALKKLGVISAKDMTFEATLTKLMFLIGQGISREHVSTSMEICMRGEFTEN